MLFIGENDEFSLLGADRLKSDVKADPPDGGGGGGGGGCC